MGQQQIFLLVIVTIIVGIATIVAINTMDASRKDANESAVRQDIFSVLSDARVYYERSGMLDGKKSFDDFSISDVNSINTTNENGTYTVSGSGKSITVKGVGTFNEVSLTAKGTMTSKGMKITWPD